MRKFVKFLGIFLITVGIGLLSYHLWMIYGTDIVANNERSEHISQFEKSYPSSETIITDESSNKHYDDPPVKTSYNYGEMIGVLHFPTWDGMKVPVSEGTGTDVLDKAYAGRYEKSDMPGDVGNFAVAAHRRTYGSNFKKIDELVDGDSVIMETNDLYIVYKVIGSEIVKPSQYSVTWSVPNEKDAVPTKRLITLTTCHSYSLGAYGNDHRYVVYGEVDYWIYKTDGKPAELSNNQ